MPVQELPSEVAHWVNLLELAPHPEGGFYRETWRDVREDGARGTGTAIYFLLRAGQPSRWHRIDATEIWHHYAGAPVELTLHPVESCRASVVLGTDFEHGERPQAIVPPHAWQTAQTQGAWSLVGCTVSPAFMFEHFELAPEGWEPG